MFFECYLSGGSGSGSANGFVEDAIGWEANEYSIWVRLFGARAGGGVVGIVN